MLLLYVNYVQRRKKERKKLKQKIKKNMENIYGIYNVVCEDEKKKKKKKRENEIRVVEIFDQHTPWGAIQARLYLIIEWKHGKKNFFFLCWRVLCSAVCVPR